MYKGCRVARERLELSDGVVIRPDGEIRTFYVWPQHADSPHNGETLTFLTAVVPFAIG